MDEIQKAQEKVLFDIMLIVADCISQNDYTRAVEELNAYAFVLEGLNHHAYRDRS